LHFEPGRRGGALVTNLQTGLKRTKTGFKSAGQSGGVVMFWLVKSVSQEPDPKVMIGEEALTAAVTKAMTEHLATRLETGQ
jgi:hypothetical protein